MADPLQRVVEARRSISVVGATSTSSGGGQGEQGPPGEAFANLDGGLPNSNYGGISPLDCGGVSG